jgi:glycosyltransferase involved in cell wall biosynthesis
VRSAPTDSITICITYHNEGFLLNRSLNSVREATLGLSNYKILIVDDHSSNSAKNFLTNDLDVQVVTNKNRIGVSGSRNLAINYATSEYIAFLDADDYYCQNFRFEDVFEDLTKFECNDFQVVILRSLISHPSKKWANMYFGPNKSFIANPKEIISKYITEVRGASIVTHVWDKLFNLEFLRKSHLQFDESMELYEDTKFSIEVLSKSEEVALIAREMTTHIYGETNKNYIEKTLDFFKLSDQLEPLLAHLDFNKANFNAAHLAKTYIALSDSPWSQATKGISVIAKSNLIREETVNLRAIRSLYLKFLVLLGVWKFPIAMALALKWYSKSRRIFTIFSSIRDLRKGKNFYEFN